MKIGLETAAVQYLETGDEVGVLDEVVLFMLQHSLNHAHSAGRVQNSTCDRNEQRKRKRKHD